MAIISNNQLPIGSFAQSMLTEAQFQALNGTGWVLADGRSVAGSAYASIVGSTVPDARGLVLRGKNHTRSTATGNADGDLNLGTSQADQNKAHAHSVRYRSLASYNVENDPESIGTGNSNRTLETAKTGLVNSDGGNETRMRNLTVNIFIKIN